MKQLYAILSAALVALAASPALEAATPSRSTSALAGTGSVKTITPRPRQASPRALARAEAQGIVPPFTHTLGKNADGTADYTAINANGDSREWKIGGMSYGTVIMKPADADIDNNDDWLLSPAIKLQAGKEYTYTIDASIILASGTKELFDICIGTAKSAEGMKVLEACEVTSHKNTEGWQTFSGTFTVANDGIYHFGFHAKSSKTESGTLALTNFGVKEAVKGIVPPFEHSLLRGQEICTQYTFADANADTRSWKIGITSSYTACMTPTESSSVDGMDDYLFTPAVALTGGKEYTLCVDMGYMGSAKRMLVDLCMGTAPNAESMKVLNTADFTEKDMTTYTAEVRVPADGTGTYYFGIHAKTPAADCIGGSLKLTKVALQEGIVEKVDLPAAGKLDVKVFPKGELKAHVTYTAPTLSTTGAPLAKIAKVQIVNRWYEKFDYEDVLPGQTIELDVDLFEGSANNRVEATAYAADSKGELHAGEAALVTGILGGLDNPLAPQNVKATLSADRKSVTVSWDPVGEVGEKGGYVDTSRLTYYIFDAFGSIYDPAVATTSETSYTLDYSSATQPDFIAYQVTAGVDETYYSTAGTSNILTYGPALKLPFEESFANASYQSVWVADLESSPSVMVGTVPDNYLQTNADQPEAEPEYINSVDGDNGFFYYLPVEANDLYGMMSLPVDIAKAVNPVLEFYAQGKGSVIDVMVGPSISEMQVVRTIDFMDKPTDGWSLYTVPLNNYKQFGAINFELRLRAVHNDADHTFSVPLDRIRVRDLKANNLSIVSVNVPETVTTTEPFTVAVTVENNGSQASIEASVKLSSYTHEVNEQAPLPPLAPGERTTVTFTRQATVTSPEQLVYVVDLISPLDMDNSDNLASVSTRLVLPAHPAPESLVGETDGSEVKLSWTAPDFSALIQPVATEDGFESYTNFAYDSFGSWTCYDVDGDKNYTFRPFTDYNPHATAPMAFQVFDPYAAGMNESDIELDAMPHSGHSMLVSWSCQGANANVLASPRLSGKAQTVTFWAKSFTSGYPETIGIYASTTGCAVADFKLVPAESIQGEFINAGGQDAVPETWTQYSVSLPEGTTHFAILMDSYDTYALFLDDFTFEAAPAIPADTLLEGYNVYCNGHKVNTAVVTDTFFSHVPVVEGEHTYSVSAVYNNAESRLCPAVTVDFNPSGIADIEADDAEAVYYDLRGIRIAAPAPGQPAIRVTAAGAQKVAF